MGLEEGTLRDLKDVPLAPLSLMAGDPEGYKWLDLPTAILTCTRCWSVVAAENLDMHEAWHRMKTNDKKEYVRSH